MQCTYVHKSLSKSRHTMYMRSVFLLINTDSIQDHQRYVVDNHCIYALMLDPWWGLELSTLMLYYVKQISKDKNGSTPR